METLPDEFFYGFLEERPCAWLLLSSLLFEAWTPGFEGYYERISSSKATTRES